MKITAKRLLSLLLAMIMVIGLLPMTALAISNASITIKTYDSAGNPIGNVPVALIHNNRSNGQNRKEIATATTDANGVVTINNPKVFADVNNGHYLEAIVTGGGFTWDTTQSDARTVSEQSFCYIRGTKNSYIEVNGNSGTRAVFHLKYVESANAKYTVTWKDGNTVLQTVTNTEGTAVSAPEAPEKTGYTFNGWDNDIAAIPGEDTVVNATWRINQYTITFDVNGGTAVAPITQDYDTAVTAPADPTKNGYTFTGWKPAVPATMPADNVAVKAQWEANEYTITFDTDDGSEVAPITQDYNTAVTAPADPTKDGYTFTGWDPAVPETMPAHNVTVKALWEKIDTTGGKRAITVTVVDGDGNVMAGVPVQLWINTNQDHVNPENNHSALSEIIKTDSYGQVVFDGAELASVKYGHYLYANVISDEYDFNWNEGKTNNVRTASPGENTEAFTASNQGYLRMAAGLKDGAGFNGSFRIAAKRTVGTITWNDWDGTLLKQENVKLGIVPTAPEAPSREGDAQYTYTFTGWAPEVAAVTGDATYTAVYESSINEYTVIWKDEDGSVLETDEDVPYGTVPTYDGAEPTKEDYVFTGWDPAVAAVTGKAEYTAQYKLTTRTLTIKTVDINGNPVAEVPVQVYQNLNKNGGEADHQAIGDVVTTDAAGVAVITSKDEDALVDLKALTYGVTVYASVTGEEYDFANTVPVRKAQAGINTAAIQDSNGNGYLWMVAETAEDGFIGTLTLIVSKAGDTTTTYNREIKVTVVDENGDPMANAPVQLMVNNNQTGTIADHSAISDVAYTDENGVVVFGDDVLGAVKKGNYVYAVINGEGYDFAWNEGKTNIVRTATAGQNTSMILDKSGQGYLNVTANLGDPVKGAFAIIAKRTTATVIWKDEDGTVLEIDKEVLYGEIPTYDGEEPAKEGNAQYSYKFVGWNPEVVAVDGDAVYTAVYEQTVNQYTVTYTDGVKDKTVFADQNYTVDYGTDTPAFQGRPWRRGYVFLGWKPVVAKTVTADVTYMALWKWNHSDKVEEDPTVNVRGLNTVDHVAYVVGRGNNSFVPTGTVTRAEAATMFFRLMTEEFRNHYWDGEASYADVADTAWYHVAVATLEEAGIIRDTAKGGFFRPNEPITRAELAVMAAQFCTITGEIPEASFRDVSSRHWAADAIALVEYAGWIEGYNGKYRPEDTITRAECVTIINRMLNRGAEAEDMLPGMVTFVDVASNAWYYEAVQEAANSHTYTRTKQNLTGESFRAERWLTVEEAPDWSALEQAWAAANK